MKSGVFIFDKPAGFTSFDAIAVLRGLFHTKKMGHTGTLDPMATGVLVVLIGSAAKALSFLEDTDKEYEAGFALGTETDTQDSTGTVLRRSEKKVSLCELQEVLPSFKGDILQIPPMYSALSQNGQRLYTLARQGIEVEREPRPIHIGELDLLSYDENSQQGNLRVQCSKGTYIRTLCADIGQKAGSFGIMTSLRRTSACGFTVSEAVTLEKARELASQNKLWETALPVESLFPSLEKVHVSRAQAMRFRNGGALDIERICFSCQSLQQKQRVKVFDAEEFIGLGQVCGDQMKVLKLLNIE